MCILQVAAIETAVSVPDIFTSSTYDFNIINLVHMEALKSNAFVGNTADFGKHRSLVPAQRPLTGMTGPLKVSTVMRVSRRHV